MVNHPISRWLVLLCLGFICLQRNIHAEESNFNEIPQIQVELIGETEAVQPGTPFWVAVQIKIPDHWHIYWKNPGDAGAATRIEWELPEGFTAAPLNWPAPKKFVNDTLVGFGYEGEILLLSQIQPPADLTGSNVELHATLKWLGCSDQSCNPGEASLSLSVPIRAITPKLNPNTVHLFTKARELLPILGEGVASYTSDQVKLSLPLPKGHHLKKTGYFCPEGNNGIDYKSPAMIEFSENEKASITLKTNNESTTPSNQLKGILVLENENNVPYAMEIDTVINNYPNENLIAAADAPNLPPLHGTIPNTDSFEGGILLALMLAFIGGMILNLMPCVLPVISLKIFSFVKMAGQNRALTIKHGLVFAAGVLASFWVLAGMLLALKIYGHSVGWGFQLQEPLFVAFLACLLMVLSLGLFGVFEAGNLITSTAGKIQGGMQASSNHEFRNSFLSGILATLLATPCTGPFLGSVLGFAVTAPAVDGFLIFTAIGLGMAAPYLVLSIWPSLLRFLPKPGAWMNTFKEVMGFLMLATVLWLTWVYGAQTGSLSVLLLLGSFFLLAIGCWIYGKWGTPIHSKRSRYTSYPFSIACIALATYLVIFSTSTSFIALNQSMENEQVSEKDWEPFSLERIAALQKEGKPVLIDFTAKWCLICQLNHMVLSSTQVENKLSDLGVVKMKADWTTNDPAITEELRKHGRNSVPLYLFYNGDPKNPPKILPQVLTADILSEHLK